MACHYHPDDLTLTLDMGRSPRNVTLYFVDADKAGRTQAIEVRDVLRPGVVLDRHTVEDFVDGNYVVWKICEPVRFHVRRRGPRDAVVSGIFFDPQTRPRPPGKDS